MLSYICIVYYNAFYVNCQYCFITMYLNDVYIKTKKYFGKRLVYSCIILAFTLEVGYYTDRL